MNLYQVKATLNGQTLVVGYGPTYYMAMKDCLLQFDVVADLDQDSFVMIVTNPQGQTYNMSLAEAKKFNF